MAEYDKLPVWRGEDSYYKGIYLHAWCAALRCKRNTGKMSEEQQQQLEQVKYWVWQVTYDATVHIMYSQTSYVTVQVSECAIILFKTLKLQSMNDSSTTVVSITVM